MVSCHINSVSRPSRRAVAAHSALIVVRLALAKQSLMTDPVIGLTIRPNYAGGGDMRAFLQTVCIGGLVALLTHSPGPDAGSSLGRRRRATP